MFRHVSRTPALQNEPQGYPRSSGAGLEVAGYSGEESGAFGRRKGKMQFSNKGGRMMGIRRGHSK
jgi:hypothetical protein